MIELTLSQEEKEGSLHLHAHARHIGHVRTQQEGICQQGQEQLLTGHKIYLPTDLCLPKEDKCLPFKLPVFAGLL